MKKAGKLIKLIHNPTAGEGEYSKDEIISLMESNGYRCDYSSSKKKLVENIDPETEFIAIAGGDGTIRKVIIKLLNKKLKYKRPIALLPFGTANNIATSLNISNDNNKNIRSWNNYHLKKFDVGQIAGLKETSFFIESFGFGIFPRLMKELGEMNREHIKTPEDEFELALRTLLDISRSYEPFSAKIELDGHLIEDDYILLEVMNIASLGPNLKLSPDADPGDGYFDVVMVSGKNRNKFSSYLEKRCKSGKEIFTIKAVRTKSLKIFSSCSDVHIDDEVVKNYKAEELDIKNMDSLLEVVVNTSDEHQRV